MPFITIFTAPKPFTDPRIDVIQRNAIRSWLSLGEDVGVILVGDEAGMPAVAAEYGVTRLAGVTCNAQGTPLVSSIFAEARRASDSPLLAYVNADILLLPDFLAAARDVSRQANEFLVIGQRWDLDVAELLDFSPGWEKRLEQEADQRGKLHAPAGSDYFLFPRRLFTDIPDFAIGRAGWDNWMIYHARQQKWPVIDATPAVRIIHQNHNYSHLPDGKPHYDHPRIVPKRGAGWRRHQPVHGAGLRPPACGRAHPLPQANPAAPVAPRRAALHPARHRPPGLALVRGAPLAPLAPPDHKKQGLIMRVGQNPAKSIDQVAQPADITVAIVTYIPYLGGYYAESLDVLKACLGSLWAHTDLPYDLLVFDNASCPEVRAYLSDAQQQGKIQFLVASDQNIGKGGAWNLIFGGAPGKIIAYADSDIYFYPGWLSALVQVLESTPKAGMVTGMPLWSPLEFSTSTIQWAESDPEARLERGELLPWEDYWRHLRSLGYDEESSRGYYASHEYTCLHYRGQRYYRWRRAFPVRGAPRSAPDGITHPLRAPHGTGALAGHRPGSEWLFAPVHTAMVGAAPGEHPAGFPGRRRRADNRVKGAQPPQWKTRLVELEARPPPVDLD